MSTRFTQLDNNGWKLTNELGFILRDHAYSVVQAREVISSSDCLCPVRKTVCLRVPCDLTSSRCTNITLPLYDAATRAPFRITAGTLLENIVVSKRSGACLDDCLHFVLGTICGNECDTDCDPQRWVSESCPISGAQLNKCKVIRVNASKNTTSDCRLFLCKSNNSCNCEPVNSFAQSSTGACDSDCSNGAPTSTSDHCSGENVDSNNCPCTLQDGSCCRFPGSCSPFAGGELEDCLVGITLTAGELRQDDVIISVELYQQACLDGCQVDEADTCTGIPRWLHGGN